MHCAIGDDDDDDKQASLDLQRCKIVYEYCVPSSGVSAENKGVENDSERACASQKSKHVQHGRRTTGRDAERGSQDQGVV